jgi:anti-anti-sigma factor
MTAPGGTGQAAVLRLSGDVDALTQGGFRRTADEIIAGTDAEQLIVDMSEVQSIDSSGLGLLVHLQAVTRANNVAMVLTHVPARASALLKRTGLDRVFDIAGPS